MLTPKQIKQNAKDTINKQIGGSLSATLHLTTNLCCIFLFEMLLYLILNHFDLGYYYNIKNILTIPYITFMWVLNIILIGIFFSYQRYINRRLFLDISVKRDYVLTRKYIFAHTNEFIKISLRSSLVINFIKFSILFPLFLSIYMIYKWIIHNTTNNLTSISLFIFMMFIGFTLIWLAVFIKYCASLALAPYIMSLNPRTNVFDACDLSAKIMKGHYSEYFALLRSFIVYIPLIVLIYPFFIIYPFWAVSYNIMIKDIMGDYWQDKLPAMIRRWEKYRT